MNIPIEKFAQILAHVSESKLFEASPTYLNSYKEKLSDLLSASEVSVLPKNLKLFTYALTCFVEIRQLNRLPEDAIPSYVKQNFEGEGVYIQRLLLKGEHAKTSLTLLRHDLAFFQGCIAQLMTEICDSSLSGDNQKGRIRAKCRELYDFLRVSFHDGLSGHYNWMRPEILDHLLANYIFDKKTSLSFLLMNLAALFNKLQQNVMAVPGSCGYGELEDALQALRKYYFDTYKPKLCEELGSSKTLQESLEVYEEAHKNLVQLQTRLENVMQMQILSGFNDEKNDEITHQDANKLLNSVYQDFWLDGGELRGIGRLSPSINLRWFLTAHNEIMLAEMSQYANPSFNLAKKLFEDLKKDSQTDLLALIISCHQRTMKSTASFRTSVLLWVLSFFIRNEETLKSLLPLAPALIGIVQLGIVDERIAIALITIVNKLIELPISAEAEPLTHSVMLSQLQAALLILYINQTDKSSALSQLARLHLPLDALIHDLKRHDLSVTLSNKIIDNNQVYIAPSPLKKYEILSYLKETLYQEKIKNRQKQIDDCLQYIEIGSNNDLIDRPDDFDLSHTDPLLKVVEKAYKWVCTQNESENHDFKFNRLLAFCENLRDKTTGKADVRGKFVAFSTLYTLLKQQNLPEWDIAKLYCKVEKTIDSIQRMAPGDENIYDFESLLRIIMEENIDKGKLVDYCVQRIEECEPLKNSLALFRNIIESYCNKEFIPIWTFEQILELFDDLKVFSDHTKLLEILSLKLASSFEAIFNDDLKICLEWENINQKAEALEDLVVKMTALHQIDNPVVFRVAYQIKLLSEQPLDAETKTLINALKAKLPEGIQKIIWDTQLILDLELWREKRLKANKYGNCVIFSPESTGLESEGGEARGLRHIIGKENYDTLYNEFDAFQWTFIAQDEGSYFLIKNEKYNKYLTAASPSIITIEEVNENAEEKPISALSARWNVTPKNSGRYFFFQNVQETKIYLGKPDYWIQNSLVVVAGIGEQEVSDPVTNHRVKWNVRSG